MKRRVLIVDDNIINRQLLRKMLGGDYAVLEAENGREAMELLEREGGDVSAILLDLIMPVMDGYEMLALLEADARLGQIPVIVATGSTDTDAEMRALSLGANDFIVKPYNPEIVRRRLWNVISLRETSAMVNALQRDSLTGLYTREHFFKRAGEMIAEREAGYFILSALDVDNFKVVNDQYGSAMGDRVLTGIAETLRRDCEAEDCICCRITADNFAMLFPAHMATDEQEDMREHEAKLAGGTPLPVTVSIGRYLVSDKSLGISAMYDRAMLAKNSVKGRFDVHLATYDETMREKLLREQEIIDEMNFALASGQFEVWFQPQYNHLSGALIGAEALVRWRHPRRGMIPPGVFIPLFERTGFVYELDKYVWERVCSLLRGWIEEGRSPLPVSVNVSRYDALREDIVEVIAGLAAKYGIAPPLLRLEITESAFTEDTERIINVVRQFVERGFTVEIDDFGSGYSSLNTLKDVPAQIVKLDMRFLENTENTSRGGNIIESVVRMIKWLGLSVIAEGVETLAQAEYLSSIGCGYIQGYLYARPMPASEYEKLAGGADKEEKMLALETVENLDNNDFWNPASMDSLIFNSYVGAACIFEYHGGGIELLRATSKFTRIFGREGMTIEQALRLNWAERLEPESYEDLLTAIRISIETRDDAGGEYIFRDLPGAPGRTYLRSSMRVIASMDDRYLIYCTNENITEERNAQQKLRETDEQLRFLNETAHELLTRPDADEGITSVLKRALEHFGGKRAYLLELDNTRRTASNTYEVCADGVSSEKDSLQGIPFEAAPFWFKIFQKDESIYIEDVETLGEERAEERDMLREQGISSLVAVPLMRGGEMIGFLGVDDPTRQQRLVSQLRAVGDYLATMLYRRDLAARIKSDSEALQNLMNDTPGGFARMRALPDGTLCTQYVNESFCRLRGMTKEEILAQDGGNAMDTVHPDDMELVRSRLIKLMAEGGTANVKYRLKCSNGAYIPFNVFARITENEAGEKFLNAYYTTMTEEEKRSLAMRSAMPVVLSAIMHTSTDLTFAKDRRFVYLCCSPAFARLAGEKDESGVIGKTDFDLFDRETAERYRKDDLRLLEGGDSMVDYIERIPSEDGVQHYSSTSKYILKDAAGEAIGIYGVGRDVTEYRTTSEQLKLLADSIPGGLATYVLKPEGLRLTYFNDGMCRMHGCTREEYQKATSEGVFAAVFDEDAPALRAQIERMIASGAPVDCTYRIHTGDGGYKWVDLRASPAEEMGGELTANAVLYDVTAQKTAAEAALIHERELQLALSQMSRAISEYNIETHTLTMSDVYYKKHGLPQALHDVPYSMQSVGGMSDGDFAVYRAFYEDICAGRDPQPIEIKKVSNGAERWERMTAYTVFDEEGKPVRALIAADDVTSQHMSYELERSRPGMGEENLLVHALINLTTGETLEYVYQDGRVVPPEDRTILWYAEKTLDTLIVDAADRERYRARNSVPYLLECCARGETELSMDYRRRVPGGEIKWTRNIMRIVVQPGGSDILLFDYFYDVSEEKKLEMLNRSLLTILENINGGVSATTVNDGQLNYLFANDMFYSMFGYTGEEFKAELEDGMMDLVHPEDVEEVRRAIRDTQELGSATVDFRARRKDGEYIWVRNNSSLCRMEEVETPVCIVVSRDITSERASADSLRMREEQFRIAADLSGKEIARYDIARHEYHHNDPFLISLGFGECIENVPRAFMDAGLIAPEHAEEYEEFYRRLDLGEEPRALEMPVGALGGGLRWVHWEATLLRDAEGRAAQAIIVFSDVTEDREKEAVYRKWQQSLEQRSRETFTLFRCNLSKNASFDSVEGELLKVRFEAHEASFNERTAEYAERWVSKEDREEYIDFMDSDALLAGYYRGVRTRTLEYRELTEEGGASWRRLTVELVEYPNSTEVEAYLMYEDIDERKKSELRNKDLAELDPLTGVLNRAAFSQAVQDLIAQTGEGGCLALIMLDIDGFKLVNDTFGHAMGDQILIDMANTLRGALRAGDLLGRLGGDEFMVCLRSMPDEDAVRSRAGQICALLHKALNAEIYTSASMGIALCPRDGRDFDTLYRKMDAALYLVKDHGKNNFAFYRDEMAEEYERLLEPESVRARAARTGERKRRLLIVEDSPISLAMMTKLFEEEFDILTAQNGTEALVSLRRLGAGISAVLLDLMMPGIDGFGVLEKMRGGMETSAIPVVVVSGMDERETSLRVIEMGAADFVTKPVNPDLLRMRVRSAVSRAESERLRSQNRLLLMRDSEESKYRAALESVGAAVAEYDADSGAFRYDHALSERIDGVFDDRALWNILCADNLASKEDAERLKALADGDGTLGCLSLRLRTPSMEEHIFSIRAKRTDRTDGDSAEVVFTLLDSGIADKN